MLNWLKRMLGIAKTKEDKDEQHKQILIKAAQTLADTSDEMAKSYGHTGSSLMSEGWYEVPNVINDNPEDDRRIIGVITKTNDTL